tara:strand:+ start:369 stop:743 length:375 start_codon:yes stop_codon:yes gene_type:complete
MTGYTEEDIGKAVTHIFPQGTVVETEVVENSCLICGDSFIGIKEEVGTLIAQHDIIHAQESKEMLLGVAHLESNELQQEFDDHIVTIKGIFENMPELRQALMTSLKVCLFQFSTVRLGERNGEN